MGASLLICFFKKNKEEIKSNDLTGFFDLEAIDINGNQFKFQSLGKMKAILVVNVASQCGLAKSHYRELTTLYELYNEQNFEILAFPCNQFRGGQETKCEKDIESFVRIKMGAKFLLFSKIEVNGPSTHPVYRFLRNNSQLFDVAQGLTQEIPFNFSKFIIDENGLVRGFYPPTIAPMELSPIIQQILSEQIQ